MQGDFGENFLGGGEGGSYEAGNRKYSTFDNQYSTIWKLQQSEVWVSNSKPVPTHGLYQVNSGLKKKRNFSQPISY
jgi:hypothetical protein